MVSSHCSGLRQDQQTSSPYCMTAAEKMNSQELQFVSILLFNFNVRFRQTTFFNDHDQYGDNVDKNMCHGQCQPV